MNKHWVSLSLLAFLVAGCASNHGSKTLGQLKYSPEREPEAPVEKMNHQQVRAEYEELIDLFEDKQLKEQIERRIADVYMMEGVQDSQNSSDYSKSYYLDAIKSYKEILEKYPNSPDNAEVLYQLAKAYDMEGKQAEALRMLEQLTSRHPYYPNIGEAYFRKGDIYFSAQRYKQAEQAYFAVTQSSAEKFQVNAHYMLGWSRYKQHNYRGSLTSYVYVMKNLFGDASDVATLAKPQQSMVKDSLHSMSLALDKLGGAAAIKTVDGLANASYVWLLYETLGDFYLEKELYQESADAFKSYVLEYPRSEKAPNLHKKLVETYEQGGFPTAALEEKATYVEAYGIHSNFPGAKQALRDDVEPVIKGYLQVLAQHYHATGQDLLVSTSADAEPPLEGAKKSARKQEAVSSLTLAAGYYQEFIETFPQDPAVDTMRFLKAEVLFQAELYEQAVVDYELVAYQPVGASAKDKAADAGYAAIICYERIVSALKDGSRAARKWQSSAVESMLQFAETFDSDKRSPAVLTSAAEAMFDIDQYQRAIDITQALIVNNTNLDKSLKKTAYGIMAHSYIKLEDYAAAETSYARQRDLIASDSDEYTQVSERLATAIYKRAEQLATGEANLDAANHFLKIKSLTPDAEIRATAQYDAVTILLTLEEWERAIPELQELMASYPKHTLAVNFPRQLAFAYEQSEQWALAATAYEYLMNKDAEAEVRREAHFLAATMHEKNKNHAAAADLFKSYAYRYETPFAPRMEARYHLATNYEAMGEEGKKLYWLRRIIDGDRKGGNLRTDRSRWLGAWANMEYGNYFAAEFNKTRLRLPLIKSLPRKNEKLQSALQRYQQAAEYGILAFVTESSYKIGSLYQVFATELRSSPVPSGLSASDKATYREIIEQQAVPFEDLAREVHTANVSRAWDGEFNPWIEKSFTEMQALNPIRFAKQEIIVSYGDEIR
ncbi:tetratricopeptide repeat protein [Teredinibacter turnerae]|uniref:tetratricopeptide repeat protein n=1 Tax=Teredinibacter turnerae TaxID=2426 RepID=UPI00040DD5BF|nr:tetratricopeptide repeat protein [Teredinibacter turnerae]